MSHIDEAFKPLEQSPTSERLEVFTSQIETLSKMLPNNLMKTGLIECMKQILHLKKFEQIRQDETMLRLWKLMTRYSENLKGQGIFEHLFKKNHFSNSLKFYLLWAEECGKSKTLDKFKNVLDLARNALSDQINVTSIESGFRDLVDEYFDGEVGNLFTEPDDTLNLFRFNPPGTKLKRRSSICHLQSIAPANSSGKSVFGPNTKTKIRPEFIDTPTQNGVSIEEYGWARWKDVFGEDVDSDTNKRKDSGVVFVQHQSTENDKKNREDVENRMHANLNPRRRHLSPLSEATIDDDEEKRSRIYSPVVPTKDAHRPPLRSSIINEKVPSTVTLSSDTKSASVKDISYTNLDETETDNEKLKLMAAGKKEINNRPERTFSTSSHYSTSSIRTAKSGAELDLMVENNCLEAHAMFSDTVHLGNEKTMVAGEDSVIVPELTKSLAPTQATTDFSVLCDPDPTMPLKDERPKKLSAGLNMVYDEQASGEEEIKEVEKVPERVMEKDEHRLSGKSLQTPPTFGEDDFFDDEMIHGHGKLSRGGIVTSTPAQGVPFVDIDAYFGNKSDESRLEREEPAFVVPTSSTLNKMMRRKSQAAAAANQAPPPPKTQAPVSQKDSSIDCLTANLGRRLSLGADEIENITVDEAEITGCKNRRRSEVIKKGDMNPWDETIRKKLMNLVRPALNMHEFQERAPKIQALRDCEVGGEVFHIQTLIGQGGYAKVYRAVNEEKKTVAVKYEVPSCSWEVYICDQMRNRLIKNGEDGVKMADWCIMKVMDAYVFSTASLLVNEYHEYGTLLEYANNMKDPNWHATCFLVTQMARILKEVHACKIIHGDIKPDNFMITRKIDSGWGKEALMSTDSFVVKIIDWGRAIDMMPLKDQTFKGRAGTEGFDSPEMIDGRSWNYQADFFGFAATMAVVATGKYAKLTGDTVGSYSLDLDIKRRNVLRDTIKKIVNTFLNISSCNSLPDWSETIQEFAGFWESNFDASAWRQSVVKFNEACDLAANHK